MLSKIFSRFPLAKLFSVTFIFLMFSGDVGSKSILKVNIRDVPLPVTPENVLLSQEIQLQFSQNTSVHSIECTTSDEAGPVLRQTKNGIIPERYRWKNFNVYPDPAYNANERTQINNAMYRLSQIIPCVNFNLYPAGATPSGDYVHIRKTSGCSSHVGRRGGVQNMSLQSPGCMSIGTIMHEMIHALGFYHEHARPDRDDYVTVLWENIQSGRSHNFLTRSNVEVTSFGVPYNTRSIMHYKANDFSANGKPTIQAKDGGSVGSMGELQSTDIEKLKRMYNC